MKKEILFFILIIAAVHGTAQWTQKANTLGNPRYDFAGFSLNAKGYIGGGRFGGPFNSTDTWMMYDPIANSWSWINVMPYRFTSLSAFSVGNFGYVANGVNDATYNYDTYSYNDVGNNWSTLASMDYPRLRSSSTSLGTKGYVICGYGFSAEPMNDFWEYNSISNQWTQKDTLPLSAARYDATAFSANGNVYIFGGTNDLDYLNDLWKYDTTSGTWAQMSPMPALGRAQCISFVINDEAYFVGGMTWTGSIKEVWKYLAASDTWVQLTDFPGATAPIGEVGFTINGKGYITPANGTNECWEFDPGITITESVFNADKRVTIAPNPVIATSILSLQGTYYVTIYDAQGKLIQSGTANGNYVLLRKDFKEGIYHLRALNQRDCLQVKFSVQ